MTTPPPAIPPWPARASHPLLPRRRGRAHPVADIALAIGLLVIDVIAPILAFVSGLDDAGYRLFDTGADNSSVSLARPFAHVAVVGGIVLISAVLLLRCRAFISMGVHICAGLAMVVVALVGITEADHEARPQPAPAVDPGARCRSGGDNSECGGS
jgi:hypothetical protein